jgi:hypothetical protein
MLHPNSMQEHKITLEIAGGKERYKLTFHHPKNIANRRMR